MKRNPNPPISVNIGGRAKAAASVTERPPADARYASALQSRYFSSRAEKRWAHSLMAMSAIVFVATPSAAVKVRVLAATHIEARVDREPASNDVVLQGILRDDVGAPVPNSHLSISIHAEGGKGPAVPLPRAVSCSPALAPDARDPHVAPDEIVVDTDAAGSFCIHSEIALARGVLELRFQGSAFLERSEAEVPFDRGRPSASLAFAPAPTVVRLDRPTYVQDLRIMARSLARGDWHVTLRDERHEMIGIGVADTEGLARVEVHTEDLDGPGTGFFTASIDDMPLAVTTHAIERRARVDLVVDDPRPVGDPEDGIAVAVLARSVRGDVPTGVVEITVGGEPVGAARVQAGRATVLARFGAGHAKTTTARLRYLPDTPWWEPGDPLTVTLQIRPPSLWRRAPLFLLALALAAWMAREPLLARLQMPRRASKRSRLLEERQEMQVGLPRKESGDWAGRVFDAHDGYPLVQATVSIVVPAFPGGLGDGGGVLSATATDENGSFALPATALRADVRLRIEAPLHATFEEPLPPPAELAIPLVSRRRRLLDRLVHWAAHEWAESVPSDPTPGEVVARATAEFAPDDLSKSERLDRVKSWARAVEHTAFDRAAVDEQAERAVVSREPRPKGSYEDRRAAGPGAGGSKPGGSMTPSG